MFLATLMAPRLAAPQVVLNQTTIVGRSLQYSGYPQEFFGNISFATAERFAQSVPASLHAPTFDASEYGPLCPQIPPTNYITAEDCLKLNIIRPAMSGNMTRNLPVMLWFPGGGFAQSLAYNGSALVANSVARGTPVIYVALNYRLGPLGFPQGDEAVRKGVLNLGLRDQIRAMEWVHTYIFLFGGDPNKVTFFGESAGAVSISMHYLNADLGKYARAAILESGAQATLPLWGPEIRAPAWQTFVNATPECAGADPNDTYGCLRKANLSTILASWGAANLTSSAPFVAVIDGEGGVVPDVPSKLLAQGQFARMPFIAGTNLDEGTIFTVPIASFIDLSNTTAANDLLIEVFRPYDLNPPLEYTASMEHFFSLYSHDPSMGSPYGTGNDTFGFGPGYKTYAAILGDFMMQTVRREWIQAATKFGVDTYGYIFTDHSAVDPNQPWLGIQHAAEVNYVFAMELFGGVPIEPTTSRRIMDYWTSFANSLNPNDGHGTVQRSHWPRYSPGEVLLDIGPNISVISDDYHQIQISYLNSVAGSVGH